MLGDGPLRYRPPEEIRYAVGRCALGALLVARSRAGIAAIVIRERPAQLLAELKARFAGLRLVRDDDGCAAFLRKVAAYVAAPYGRFPLALDLRGTAFQKRVWREVQKIPVGRTSTYSEIAEAIGSPKAIRGVASSCARCGWAFAVPCHRVMHKGGVEAVMADPQGRRRYRWVTYESALIANGRGRKAAP